MPNIRIAEYGEERQLPYDGTRRCNMCSCLFSERDWDLAWVGFVDGVEQAAIIHEDCFTAQWNQKPLPRAWIPKVLYGATL